MPALPLTLIELKAALNRLPGIGPRSAERMALHLVQGPKEVIKQLTDCMQKASERVQICHICGGLTEEQPCQICDSPGREPGLICVVVKPTDILSLEKTGSYAGHYHVLGGHISPLNGVGPEDLNIAALEKRLDQSEVQELILALGSDVEGDATSYYLAQRLGRQGLKITKIAQGLPAGSDLDFADELTLNRALQGRIALDHEG
ncbi:MAG: recombination mediator RecR [Limisphaerales bacterium]|jgi:recombination protein RecR